MFKLERFFAFWTFELAQHCAFIVTYHVPLEAVNVGERLVAHLTRLQARQNKKKHVRVIKKSSYYFMKVHGTHIVYELQGYKYITYKDRVGLRIGRRKKERPYKYGKKKRWRVKSHDQKNLRRSPKNPMPGDDDALLKIIIKRKKRRLERRAVMV